MYKKRKFCCTRNEKFDKNYHTFSHKRENCEANTLDSIEIKEKFLSFDVLQFIISLYRIEHRNLNGLRPCPPINLCDLLPLLDLSLRISRTNV